TNDYSTKVGHLTFTKVFENHEVSAEDGSNIIFQIQDSEGNAVTGYENITLESMKQPDGTYSYTTGDDLEIGKSYKVVETNANQPTGWIVTTTYKVGEREAKAEAQTVEVSETTANTEIKNSYTQDVGKLTFTKSFSGDELTKEQTSGISFKVKNVSTEEVVGTYSLADITNSDGSYSKTIEGLPVGKYEVIETNAGVNGYTVTTTYKVNGTDSENGAVEIAKDSENTVAITNDYSKKVGHLTFTKMFENHEVSTEDEQNITFQIQDSVGNAVTGYDSITLESMKQTDGTYSYTTRDDLEIGKSYKVVETRINRPAGWTVTTTYKVGEGEAKAEAQTVEVSETTANTEIKNSYTQDVGKLTFTKSFSGDALTEDQLTGIIFTVKNVSTNTEVGTYSLSDMTNLDGRYSKTIENLPVGNYEVIETNAGVNGYTVTTTYKVNGTDSEKGAVEIAKDSENTVDITNNYIQLVSYTVKKEWNLNGTEGVVIPETITVRLTANGNAYGDSVELHASENWTYTWDNLPKSDSAGEINYSVKEIEAPEGYTVSAVTDTVSRVITLTNTYTNGKEVTFSKEDVAGKELPGATMSISVKNGEEVSRWVSTSEKNVVTLAPGNYTLTELTAPNGYLKAQSIDFTLDAEGKVLVDGNPVSEVVMVDEYASHDVVISKVDAANNKELAGAVLKVTDNEGNEVDTWTSEDGKNHTVTVKPGTYTFTEVSAPKGYELAESITFNVDLNGKVTIDGKQVTAVVMKDAKKPTNVQTGVHTNVGGFGALGGFSIGMAFIVLFLRKKMD
ncbi:MAG: SpaA isopeptide-forming pilin-related protein, partial [Bulleidia sp.]|nr:SpaA isopeptide-forming pilin-related protein [Bulleidia sp.]